MSEQAPTTDREPTTLEVVDSALLDTIATGNAYEVRDAITERGLAHVAMGPGSRKNGLKEIWAGMHGRSSTENLAILGHTVAQLCASFSTLNPNPLTVEHQAVLNKDRKAAKQQRADEQ